jgi:hypothetical protein
MAIRNRTQLIDILTTLLLFGIAIAGLYMAQGYPGRAGMWPTYVMGVLLVLVCIHLFNLGKDVIRPPAKTTKTSTSE